MATKGIGKMISTSRDSGENAYVMELATARALLAAAEDGEEDSEPIYVPAAVLHELAPAELPAGVLLGVGEHRDRAVHVDWEGVLLNRGGSIVAEVDLTWTKKYWSSSIGLDHYLDLVRRAVEKRERTHGDAHLIEHEDDDEPWVRLVFELSKLPDSSLGAAYRAARKLTAELHEPAEAAADVAGRVIADAAQRLDGWGSMPLDALVDQIDRAANANTKGRLLEELTARIFETVPGISAIGRVRTTTEEIDVTLLNGSADPRLARESAIILAECKNWSSVCGKNEFVVFRAKVENRSERCALGFLVSWNGFAETITSEMLRGSREKTLIVPLSGAQLRAAVRDGTFATVMFEAWQKAVML